ncbi:hypothetical protein HN747_01310 [archaeon]|jgi:hypothetical protein|nr:hypothetical protein [archaeon]
MLERYKLQYFGVDNTVLSISLARGHGYSKGDCRVRTIHEHTNPDAHNRARLQSLDYSEPMSIESIKTYIAQNKRMLGSRINNCVGITLEDTLSTLDFDKPISVRS